MLTTQESARRVVDRWVLRQVVRRVCATDGFRSRSAALQDLTPQVVEAFGEAFVLQSVRPRTRVALLGGLGGKIKKLWKLFRKAPQLWSQIKEFLGIEGLRDIPRKLKEWAKKGMLALKKGLKAILFGNPVAAMYFIPKAKMPGVTDMLQRVGDSHPKIRAALRKVNTGLIQPIDKVLAKSKALRTMARPLLAAAFIWIWLNVAEVTWDLPGLVKGFTGGISFGELVSSLPESGIGLLVATLFPGLGTFALLPATIMARVVYLIIKKIIVWVSGKGFLVDWMKLGMPEKGREMIPAF